MTKTGRAVSAELLFWFLPLWVRCLFWRTNSGPVVSRGDREQPAQIWPGAPTQGTAVQFWASGPADQVFGQVLPSIFFNTDLDGELSVLGVRGSGSTSSPAVTSSRSSSSLARRACVHIDFVFWDFLNYGSATGPFGDRGDTPRCGLMAGTAACCTQFFSYCPFSFPVQPQSTELPATTEGRWRRRHLSPGHKAGLLTVLLTCTGCAFQVTPGVEKSVTL